jgi:hypothetical protein
MELKKANTAPAVESESINTEIETPTPTPEAVVDTPINEADVVGSVSESPVTDIEADKEPEPEVDTTGRVHNLMYIAGGIWTDANGVCWCHSDKENCVSTMSLTDIEYQARGDIQFMVNYGHMKDIIFG